MGCIGYQLCCSSEPGFLKTYPAIRKTDYVLAASERPGDERFHRIEFAPSLVEDIPSGV
jgi:hypothetical protein